MLAATLAALLLATPVTTSTHAAAQEVLNAPQESIRLEDLTVVGRPLDRLIDNFTREVSAPNPGRNLARWRDTICVSTFNIAPEGAQYLIDRVSTVAQDVGLRPGGPGCKPSVLVIAATNADETANALVERRARAFRVGGAGMDRGGPALLAFQNNQQPVRWWQVSVPVDALTLQPATRISGNAATGPSDRHTGAGAPAGGKGSSTLGDATTIRVSGSRLTTELVDDIYKTIIILDADEIGTVSSQQLADYVAMITLAQINPVADASGYASILNVFKEPTAISGLTEWDKAYLKGLYTTQRTQRGVNSAREEIVSSILRAHQQLRADNN